MPEAFLTSRIVEWDRRKGYGFLQMGKERVFLHRHDFSEYRKAPAVGDKIRFTLGRDAKGRSCARNAVHATADVRIIVKSILVLGGLLVLPFVAVQRQDVGFRWVSAYGLVVSALSYWAYALDKRRAQVGNWRVSETRLHVLELAGGWPGAFLAQRWLRHKCSKRGYLVVFWLIVLAYQFAAADSLQNWRLSRAAWNRIQSMSDHRR